jgi:hypothetical protein
MEISRKYFVITFLIMAFAFQFISNSVLGPKIGLFPASGAWFPGTGSSIGWKSTLATILYPVKYVLVGPLSFLGTDPDPAPPVMLVAFTLYWTAIALVLHFLLSILFHPKKA